MVQFMGDFEPFAPAPVVPGTVVELQMMLIDKSKSSTVKGPEQLLIAVDFSQLVVDSETRKTLGGIGAKSWFSGYSSGNFHGDPP